MKIAFFNYLELERGGGTARFFSEVSVGLKARFKNLDISLVTLDSRLNRKINSVYSFYFRRNVEKEQKKSNTNLQYFFKKKGVNYFKVSNFKKLSEVLGEFDVIYSKNDLVEAFILKFIVGYNHLAKVIFGFHTPIVYQKPYSLQSYLHNFLYSSFLYKNLIKDAAAFHVLNSFTENKLKLMFRDKVISKIYNPYDYGRQFKIKDQGSSGLKILWIGRLTREKGIDDLIKLIRNVNSKIGSNEVQWSIAGNGEYEPEVKKLAEEYGNVDFLGFLGAEDLEQIYQKSDLFLATSRWESFPYTFLEAQSFGLPIACYDIPGCNDVVVDKLTGYLASSLEEIEKKILYLTFNKKKLVKRDTVRKKIKELVNNESIYKKLYDLLQ